MTRRRPAPYVGVVACVAVVLALAAPYVLISQPGTGLAVYYASGPLGAFGVAFLALLEVVVFLSGERGSADPTTAAGIALAVGLGAVVLALVWALTVDPENVMSFPAAWMGWHRWLVLALTGVVVVSAGAYTQEVL